MAKKIEMYESFDGEVFRSEGQCKDHERLVKDNDRIESFLRSEENVYDKPAHRTAAETTLLAFCAWIRNGEGKVVEKKMEDLDG
jgi:hypothetical protein